MNRFFTLFLIFCVSQSAYTQNLSWRQYKKLATKFASEKLYEDAAENFNNAFNLNTSNKELLFLAANNYFECNDYINAIDAYGQLKDNFSKYPQADLKYAYALKQNGQYEEAVIAFALFDNNYDGTKKMMWRKLVANEIKGCELGQALQRKKTKNKVALSWLNRNVNSGKDETAPLLFGDDLLYYTSDIGETQGIYRSQRLNGDWQLGQEAQGLPEIVGDFGNGAFSPTKERFYFTTCDDIEIEKGVQKNICQLNFIQQTNNGWSTPTPLPETVNSPNATSTQPTVVHMLEKEVVFFSSDRKGGKGGLDIWYTTTSMTVDSATVFTRPNNLGRMVNSVRDDVTPFYDVPTETLYFSSNGYQSIGGFDIFASKGDLVRFDAPVHMGLPINSPADDLFYITSPVTESTGLFISNRLFGNQKTDTKNLDIFSYSLPQNDLMVKGSIMDKATKKTVSESKVALYEVLASGKKRLLSKINTTDGAYQFKLLPNRKFVIESDKDGYPTASAAFNTVNLKSTNAITKDLLVDKKEFKKIAQQPIYSKGNSNQPTVTTAKTTPVPSKPIASTSTDSTPTTSSPVVSTPTVTSPTTTNTAVTKPTVSSPVISTPAISSSTVSTPSVSAPAVSTPIIATTTDSSTTISTPSVSAPIVSTPAPAVVTQPVTPSPPTRARPKKKIPQGEFYKIQIIVVKSYQPNHPRYDDVKELTKLEVEDIDNKNLERVMIGDFFSLAIAKRKLSSVRMMTDFTDAFIVRYKGGRRVGKIGDDE